MSAESSKPTPKKSGSRSKNVSTGLSRNAIKRSKSKFYSLFRAYDEETAAINAMRGMLEDENNQKRAAMMRQEETSQMLLGVKGPTQLTWLSAQKEMPQRCQQVAKKGLR